MKTLSQVRKLDSDEMLRGYMDGHKGKQSASLEESYQHGWENGIADYTKKPDFEQRWLAGEYAKEQRFKKVMRELKQ